ncbi:GumC family protein [Undibacterium squillarum]|uniref:GumC family protein n=1 Tax=Undibacterium squillarum TaxID=1131567 RepID=UPI0035B4A006
MAERVIRDLGLMDTIEARKLSEKYGSQRAIRDMAESVAKNIEVAPRKNSRVIEILYSSGNPQTARDVVNSAIRAYIDLSLEMMNAPARARKDQYNAQLETLSKQIDDIQKKLTAYQEEFQIVDVDERADLESKQMAALSARLIELQMARVEAQSKRQTFDQLIRQGNPGSDLPEVAGVGHISGVKAALTALDAQIANAKTTLGPRHPKFIALQDERQNLVDKLQRESATAIASLNSSESRLRQQEKEIESELAAYQKKTFENKKHRNVINSYQRQLDSVQKVYNAAIQKFDELLMTSNVAIANASVMRWAELPEKASKPLLKNNLIFGAIAGLMFSLSLSFLLELRRRKVRCVEDLEKEFDVPVMAQVGFNEKERYFTQS